MKKISKLLMLALLAGAMTMISCKEPEPGDETIADGAQVTFGDASWTAEAVDGTVNSNVFTIDA